MSTNKPIPMHVSTALSLIKITHINELPNSKLRQLQELIKHKDTGRLLQEQLLKVIESALRRNLGADRHAPLIPTFVKVPKDCGKKK